MAEEIEIIQKAETKLSVDERILRLRMNITGNLHKFNNHPVFNDIAGKLNAHTALLDSNPNYKNHQNFLKFLSDSEAALQNMIFKGMEPSEYTS